MLTVINEIQNIRLATGTTKAFNTQFIHRLSNPRWKPSVGVQPTAAGQRLAQYSVCESIRKQRQTVWIIPGSRP